MKAVFVLAAAAGVAVAQNLSGEPSCAIPCLTSAIVAAGCALTDQGCQCGPSLTAISTKAATCVLASCNPTDINSAIQAGSSLCAAYSSSLTATSATTTSGTVSITGTITSTGTASFPTSTGGSSGFTSAANATLTTSTLVVGTNSTTLSLSKTPSTTSSPLPQTPNAAATPVALGLGAVLAILGVAVAL